MMPFVHSEESLAPIISLLCLYTIQWRPNKRDCVSNDWRPDCLPQENTKAPRHWPLWATGGFPSHGASNVENVSIWWRHHELQVNSYTLRPRVGNIWWFGRKLECVAMLVQFYIFCGMPWWRHQMETFSALLALCAWSPVNSSQKASDAELWCFL